MSKPNPFMPIFREVLHLIKPIEFEQNTILALPRFRNNVQQILLNMESNKRLASYSPYDKSAVKYALVAFVDEFFLNRDTESSDIWRQHPLQVEYFNELLAGERFFIKLDELYQAQKKDVLEIYYYCLLLGFKGKYALIGEKELKQIKLKIKSCFFNPSSKVESVKHHLLVQEKTLVPDSIWSRITIKKTFLILISSFVLMHIIFYLLSDFSTQRYLNSIKSSSQLEHQERFGLNTQGRLKS